MLSIFEFQKRFPDEEACFKYLYEQKWPLGFVCPRCDHPDAYFIKTRRLLQCKSCKHQASVTAGTIFHKMRQPLLVLLWACYWLATTKKGISSKELQRKLGLKSYQTAWTLSHKIRKAMKSSGQYPIQNDVEFDEAFLGLPDEASESSRRALVKAVVETDGNFIGRAYLEHLQSGTAKTIQNFIHKCVKPGVVIKTDGHPLYQFLKQHYEHRAHKMYRNKDDIEKNLPKIHMVIANLKMWLAGTFNCMPYKHAQRYLDEFCFRFNRRWKLEKIFDKLIIRAVRTSPITYAELTG
jgi:hypothetical protein